jgi:hypothetical protein
MCRNKWYRWKINQELYRYKPSGVPCLNVADVLIKKGIPEMLQQHLLLTGPD